jgi:hypothetical protein
MRTQEEAMFRFSLIALFAVLALASAAFGADRIVQYEHFTAAW